MYPELTEGNSFLKFCEKSSLDLSIKDENYALSSLKAVLNELFEDNFERFLILFWKIPETFQNLLFYNCWVMKGRILGVHNDFGRHSLLNSDQISSNYHCEREEIINLLLQLSETLEDFEKNS